MNILFGTDKRINIVNMKSKSLIFLVLATLFCACGSSTHVVKSKQTSFSFKDTTEEEIPVLINVLVGDALSVPQQPVVFYQLSYSITNQSKDKTLVGYIDGSDGQRKNAFLSVQLRLSDGSIMENRANIVFINQVSPQITSSYQQLSVQIPKDKSIVEVSNAKIIYETQNLPSIKIN